MNFIDWINEYWGIITTLIAIALAGGVTWLSTKFYSRDEVNKIINETSKKRKEEDDHFAEMITKVQAQLSEIITTQKLYDQSLRDRRSSLDSKILVIEKSTQDKFADVWEDMKSLKNRVEAVEKSTFDIKGELKEIRIHLEYLVQEHKKDKK